MYEIHVISIVKNLPMAKALGLDRLLVSLKCVVQRVWNSEKRIRAKLAPFSQNGGSKGVKT